MNKIGIITAVDFESSTVISKMKNVVKKVIDGVHIFDGILCSRDVVIAISGMGEINATIAAMVLSANYELNYILNFGSCGSHYENLDIGDIIVIRAILNGAAIKIDEPKGSDSSFIQIGNPKFFSFEFNGNSLDLDPKLLETDSKYSQRIFTAIRESAILNSRGGRAVYENITSADNWNTHKKWINYLHTAFGSYGEEMEANAIATVCYKRNIPFVAIKIVSNNELMERSFDKSVCEILQEIILETDIINKIR